jgi:ABC-2 type transport system permease protein
MRSFQIFSSRMLRDWRFQLKAFRAVADWTIWLYFIIPGSVIFLFIYRSWWTEPAPGWIDWMPISLLFIGGSLFSWGGSFRSYSDEADKVFLMKKENLFLKVKKWGFFYSIFYQALVSLLAFVILLPFMIKQNQLTWMQAFHFFLYSVGLKYFLIYVKFQLKKIKAKTIRIINTIILFVVFSYFSIFISALWISKQYVILFSISLLLGLAGIYLYYPLLKRNSLFELGLAMEQDEKQKMVNLIYQMSFEIEKPKVYSQNRPWLFRNSTLVFKNRTKKNGFLELFMKIFIRNSSYVVTYFQISSVTAAALVIVPPIWIKAIIFGGFLFMMWVWLEGTWERIVLSHPLTKKYNEQDSYFAAKDTVIGVLFILSIIYLGVVVGVALWIYKELSVFT